MPGVRPISNTTATRWAFQHCVWWQAGRLRHWQHSLSMLDGRWDLLLGKGLGRYADNYAIAAPGSASPPTSPHAVWTCRTWAWSSTPNYR